MAKRPKDSPSVVGQKVILRGRGARGEIYKIDDGGWVWINWDDPKADAPKICHVNELAVCTTGDVTS